jgi:hypothetical protein
MFGKGAILMVIGFSLIFLIYIFQIFKFSTTAATAYDKYYSKTIATEIAISAANMSCNALYLDSTWVAGYSNVSFMGGTFNVTVSLLAKNRKSIQSISNYFGYYDTVTVLVQPTSFSRYGNFYSNLSAEPATGDTFDGPFHTNASLTVSGNPVFKGNVTYSSGNKPSTGTYLDGIDKVASIPISLAQYNYATLATSSGTFAGTGTQPYVNVDMTLNSNGTITTKYQTGASLSSLGTWTTPVTTALSTLAPNGVVYIKQGNLTIRGTLSGQLTVYANKQSTTDSGIIYIDNSITYNNNPITNPSSTDLLGLMADGNIHVTYNNSRGDIAIQASLLAQNGTFLVDNYSSYSTIYNMDILGGVIANDIGATASYSGGLPVKGYRFDQTYDTRFNTQAPPYFPTTGGFSILSWYE